jgi:putative transcriptional regulator
MSERPESLKGYFLMASPALGDPNFYRTVVLLLEHTDSGAIGLVLNRPTSRSVRDVWAQLGRENCHCDAPLHIGGPVAGPLMALHNEPDVAEAEVMPGVYFSAQRDHLDQLVASPPPAFRIFTGYSGWAEGQLEGELAEGAWLTVPATAELIFYSEGDLWRRIARQLSQAFYTTVLGSGRLPPKEGLN